MDESPSEDDSGSDFEPEAGSKRKRTTPVKKKPVKGSAAKKPTKAGGRGRGAGRAGRAPGRGRKDPSLSPGLLHVYSSIFGSIVHSIKLTLALEIAIIILLLQLLCLSGASWHRCHAYKGSLNRNKIPQYVM